MTTKPKRTFMNRRPRWLIPLIVLAFLSVVGGFVNMGVIHFAPFDHFLAPVLDWREREGAELPLAINATTEWILLGASALLAIGVALWTQGKYQARPNGEWTTASEKHKNPLWRTLSNKWGVDDIYNNVLVKPGYLLSRGLWRTVDTRIVDGIVKAISGSIGRGGGLKNAQSGYVRNYAFSMLVGVFVVVAGCLIGLLGRK